MLANMLVTQREPINMLPTCKFWRKCWATFVKYLINQCCSHQKKKKKIPEYGSFFRCKFSSGVVCITFGCWPT